ncbi:transporter [Pokkaliibacter plantistimulans]|uniref:Transporter n=2 Tax=Pseudomonadota TaxID=1224 RepID=A0A2S5KVG3_9PROT|nr:transporter [Pokkaliibacter plantistimulans]
MSPAPQMATLSALDYIYRLSPRNWRGIANCRQERNKRMHKPLAISLLCAGLSLHTLSAQAESLIEVYEMALKQDPQLRSAEAERQASAEIIPQRKADLLPNINGTAGIGNADYDRAGDFDFKNYELSLTQPLFNRSSWYALKQGKIEDQAAAIKLEIARQDLISRVITAYIEVLRSKSQLSATEAEEAAIKRRLEQAQAQYDVGLVAVTDVEEAKASYQRAQVARIQAANAVDTSLEALERLTNTVVTQVNDLKKSYSITDTDYLSLDDGVDKSIRNNLNIAYADTNYRAAKMGVTISESGHYPTVGLNLSHGYTKNESTIDGDYNKISLSVSVPLYSGGAVSSKVRQAYATANQYEADYDDALREIRQQTRTLLRNLQTNVATVTAQDLTIKASDTALKATEAGYEVGTRNVVDVLDAEQNLYQSIRDYANARYDYVANQVKLKQLQGALSVSDIRELDGWLTPLSEQGVEKKSTGKNGTDKKSKKQ